MHYDLTKLIPPSSLNVDELIEHANAGDPSALFMGSYVLQSGYELLNSIDESEAIDWAKTGSETGDKLCIIRYNAMKWMSTRNVEEKRATAALVAEHIEWLKQTAEQGHPYAQSMLGFLWDSGVGVPVNKKEAIRNYDLAAKQGEPCALFNLGDSYENGDGVAKDKARAVNLYKAAAKTGHVFGLTYYSNCYIIGSGVKKSYPRAMALARRAALQGNLLPIMWLAQTYAGTFKTITPNHDKAFMWCKIAANKGDGQAEIMLGDFYSEGHGTKQSWGRAAVYWRRAALKGHVQAKIRLARMYENTKRQVPTNYALAYRWYRDVSTSRLSMKDTAERAIIILTQSRVRILQNSSREVTENGQTWRAFQDGSMARDLKPVEKRAIRPSYKIIWRAPRHKR